MHEDEGMRLGLATCLRRLYPNVEVHEVADRAAVAAAHEQLSETWADVFVFDPDIAGWMTEVRTIRQSPGPTKQVRAVMLTRTASNQSQIRDEDRVEFLLCPSEANYLVGVAKVIMEDE